MPLPPQHSRLRFVSHPKEVTRESTEFVSHPLFLSSESRDSDDSSTPELSQFNLEEIKGCDANGLVSSPTFLSILSCCLLITGNTIGASMMVLPSVASSVGLPHALGIIESIYFVNIISGLTISEVAIKQHEMGCDAPVSFKDFVNEAVDEGTGNIVAGLFIYMNWCIVSFDTSRFGEILHQQSLFSGFEPTALSFAFCAVLSALVTSLSSEKISRIGATCTFVLFMTFGAILIPGLGSMQDPMITLAAPPSIIAGDVAPKLASVAPVFLSSMIYQNIVPTAVKLLSYDRFSTVLAIVVGSTTPVLMYLAYIFASLGGGIQTVDPHMVTTFAFVSLTGGCTTAILSLAEEFSSVIDEVMGVKNDACELPTSPEELTTSLSSEGEASGISLPAVVLATMPPLTIAALYSNGSAFVDALKWAGTYGSPFVYGLIPAVLAYLQRKEEQRAGISLPNIVPGGNFSLFVLGSAAVTFAAVCSVTS